MPVWLKVTTAVVSLVLLGGLAFAGYWYFRLQSNISSSALGAGSNKTDSVDDATGRLQILILGSDTRDGKNADYGTADDSKGYGKSDVMMLMASALSASPGTFSWTSRSAPTRRPARSTLRART